jgi:sugar lactone lactonase YvrE
MRRYFFLLIPVVILISSAAYVYVRFIRNGSPPPTTLGWRAQVSTVAGDGSPAFRDDPHSDQAAFADPFAIALNRDGVIYVSDAGNSNRIRKLTPDGTVTTLAGGAEGYADGLGANASFNTPSGLALDANGNVYVADTGNNRIRKITPEGLVSTIAGDGKAGYADGPALQARFDGPIGIAVDAHDDILIADTYNDRVRMITPSGNVTTLAGVGRPGYQDGAASGALFDTPCGVVSTSDGSVVVADTGNSRLRKISQTGNVTTVPLVFPPEVSPADLAKPIGLALTHDGFLYVTELDRARVVQIAPDGAARVIAGGGPGYADGSDSARFNQLTGIAINPLRKGRGDLYVADSGNYLVRRLTKSESGNIVSAAARTTTGPLPRLTNATLGEQALLWPLEPQQRPHEVVATIGEVRGSFDSTDSRDHLHSGLDVFGAYGDVVHAVRSEKVVSPLGNWGFGSLNEGMRVGVFSYIHVQVGRDKDAKVLSDARFVQVKDENGKLARIRVRRGTRFKTGDVLGTINRMYHVHLNVGPPGVEINPLSLGPLGFIDDIAPVIEKDGIQLFDESGSRLAERSAGRLLVHGRVRIVVDAFDRTNLNASRRRLGLYRLGYQLLKSDGAQLSTFGEPRINIVFDRLPPGREAPKITYAEQSGITVYGSATTRFLYEVTSIVRDGQATRGFWDTSELPNGDYILRIIAADYSGNEAKENRDVLLTVKNGKK